MMTENGALLNRLGRFRAAVAVALAALAVSGVFMACSRTDQKAAGPLEKVTIACSGPPYTALVDIAQARGYFRQEGLEATMHFLPTGRAALDEALAGKADFATTAETPFMFAILKGEKIAIIASIQSSNKVNVIFGRKDRGIRTPQDLKGKKIGVTLGGTSEFFLDAFLAVQGITRKDIRSVNLRPEEMPGALAKGEVDAFSTYREVLNQVQKSIRDKSITFSDKNIYTQTFDVVATQESIHKNPGRVKKMLRALIKAEEFVMQHPEDAQQTVAETRQMDRALLGEVWAYHTFSVSLDQSLLLVLEDESRWAIKAGLTAAKKVPDYLDFIYLDGLASVKPQAVRIVR